MAKALIFIALLALPVILFLWSRSRKPKPLTIDPHEAYRRVKAGEKMEGELARSYVAYAMQHSQKVIAIVEHAFSKDEYGLVLENGQRVRAERNRGMWQRGMQPAVGQRVLLSIIPGNDRGTIENMM